MFSSENVEVILLPIFESQGSNKGHNVLVVLLTTIIPNMNNEILYIDSENKMPCSSRIVDIKEFLQVDIITQFIEIITPNQQEKECMHGVMLSSYLIVVHNSYKKTTGIQLFIIILQITYLK